MRRLRAELQRRETALHRAEAQSASLGRELTVATEELGQLRGRMEGEGVGVGEEGGESGESEGEEGGLAEEGSAQELVHIYICMCMYTVIPTYTMRPHTDTCICLHATE